MSKERARLRAERLAVAEREKAVRARRVARRQRRRALVSRLRPRRRGRVGKLRRYTVRQQATIVVLALIAATTIWLLVDDLGLRIVLVTLLLLGLPVFVVITLGRRL